MSNDQKNCRQLSTIIKFFSAILAKKFDRWGKIAIFKVATFKVTVGYL